MLKSVTKTVFYLKKIADTPQGYFNAIKHNGIILCNANNTVIHIKKWITGCRGLRAAGAVSTAPSLKSNKPVYWILV